MTTEEKDLAVFNGFATLVLRRQVGDVKEVKVKCLPIRKFAEYASLIEDESALVEIFTGLSADEVDALHRDDFVKIIELGHALNFEAFTDWLKRKVSAKKMIASAFGVSLPKTDGNQAGESSAS